MSSAATTRSQRHGQLVPPVIRPSVELGLERGAQSAANPGTRGNSRSKQVSTADVSRQPPGPLQKGLDRPGDRAGPRGGKRKQTGDHVEALACAQHVARTGPTPASKLLEQPSCAVRGVDKTTGVTASGAEPAG
jgi:hypothetical protein